MTRTFSGTVDQDGLYAWLNPAGLSHAQKYDRDRLLSDYVETDEPTYGYFLGMLPPMNFTSEGFAICEETTDGIRLAFFRIDGKCFAAQISDRDPVHKMRTVRDQIAAALQPISGAFGARVEPTGDYINFNNLNLGE